MGAYQAPNVQVRQVFRATPPGVATEGIMPGNVVASAFDVYEGAVIGDGRFEGVFDESFDFIKGASADKVVYTSSYGDVYDRYPVKIFARPTEGLDAGVPYQISGTSNLGTITASTVPVKKAARYVYRSMSGAYTMPFYNSGVISVVMAGGKTFSGYPFAASGIVPGLSVYGTISATITPLGTIVSVSEDTITLDTPVTGTVTNLYIGIGDATKPTVAAFLYVGKDKISDLNVGDVVTNIVRDDATIATASVVHVDQQNGLIHLNVLTQAETNVIAATGYDKDLTTEYPITTVVQSSLNVVSFSIDRFVGYMPQVTVGSDTASGSSGSTSVTLSASNAKILASGYLSLAGAGAGYYKIKSITTTAVILETALTGAVSGAYLAWSPKSDRSNVISSDISADYRNVRMGAVGSVLRVASFEDIENFWGDINVFNDIAFMANDIKAKAGNQAFYGVSIDPTDEVSSVAAALDALMFFDVYSTAVGSNTPSVNSLMPGYVDAAADPYEGHERIVVVTYKKADVYRLATVTLDSMSTTGLLTVTGVDLRTTGLGIGDIVTFMDDSSTPVLVTAIVTGTPTALTVQTNYTTGTAITVNRSATLYAGVKSKQAAKISALGAQDDRRVTVAWAGRLYGIPTRSFMKGTDYVNNTPIDLPSFFISSAIVGMDIQQRVSQSLTNVSFGITGIDSIQTLETNDYFRKGDLDTIGGGGIDIIMLDASGLTMHSRHDMTSNELAVEYRERSITKQADKSAKVIRMVCAPYVGKFNITKDLLGFIQTMLASASQVLVRQGDIQDIQIISVQRDPNIADKINIKRKVTVFVAGNYWDIEDEIVSR